MFIVKVGVSQQYNIYTKTAIFFEKVVVSCIGGASRRASDLVQFNKRNIRERGRKHESRSS